MRKNEKDTSTYTWTSSDGTKQIILLGADGITESDILILLDLDRLEGNNDRRYRRHHPSMEVHIDNPDKAAMLADPEVDVAWEAVDQLDRILLRKALHTAMQELSPRQARLLEQVYVEELPLREIARREGVHDNAIRKRLQVILKKIKEKF